MDKKTIAWILILVPAAYIAYHSYLNGAFKGNVMHMYVLISVGIWLFGDYLLSKA